MDLKEALRLSEDDWKMLSPVGQEAFFQIRAAALRDLARLEGENVGTDRHGLADDKLGRAVSKLTSYLIGELQHHGSVNYTYPEFQEALKSVRDAARDETATKGEAPKKASLGELVRLLELQAMNPPGDGVEFPWMREAAAVLRSVGELKSGNLGLVDFMRGLP